MLKDATRRAREHQRAVFTGRAAPIRDVVFPQEQLTDNLGFTRTYCPVSWATRGELRNQAGSAALRQYGCLYRGKFYFPAGPKELEAFVADPARYLNRRRFPTDAKLPHRVAPSHVSSARAKVALKGFCPVAMLAADRYEDLVSGELGLPVMYRKRLFLFSSEDALEKFMACPDKYARQQLPRKLPPRIKAVAPRKLAQSKVAGRHGYLELELSELLVKAMAALEKYKGTLKHPALSAEGTVQVFVALYLTAHNPNEPESVRTRQARRLQQYVNEATVASRLLSAAPRGSGARAARLSPRNPQIAELGAAYARLSKETLASLRKRFLLPAPGGGDDAGVPALPASFK